MPFEAFDQTRVGTHKITVSLQSRVVEKRDFQRLFFDNPVTLHIVNVK